MKKHSSFLRLLTFEWRKNFLSPWLLIFTAVLLLLNSWKLHAEYSKKTEEFASIDHIYEDFYAQWCGSITAEKIESLMEVYGPLEDFGSLSFVPGSGTYADTEMGDHRFLFSNFYNEMKYDYLYVNQAIEIAQRAEALTDLRPEAAKEAELFRGRSIPQFADTRYIEVWLNHDYSAMLVLLLSLFGLCTVFVTERETQMFMLQRTARNGGAATAGAKLAASVLYMILLCLLFFGEDFLILQLLSGHWEALSSPVYAVRALAVTPLRMTIGCFVLWSGFIRTLGILGCGWLMLLASALMKRVLTAFGGGLAAVMGMVVLQENCRTRVGLKWFDPMELVMVREIVSDTNFVTIFGVPILMHHFVIAGVVVTILVLTVLILRFQPGQWERRR